MTKRALKKLYREYVFGATAANRDDYKMKNGDSWDTMMQLFTFNLPEKDREQIHQEYANRCKIAA